MTFIVIIIALALIFDFINGFHDAANSIATVVSTRVLKPYLAVLWAAFFNFAAFFFFETKVANTIGAGLVDPLIIDANVIFAALLAAIFWNLLTWYYGIPSSSSHALIGGIIGSAVAKSGIEHLNLLGISKVLISIIGSPLLGLLLGFLLMIIVYRLFFFSAQHKTTNLFKKLQLISSAWMSLGHGGNDAQKTMGIIAVLLYSSNLIGPEFHIPLWVVLSCYFVMSMGTLFGGWRIIKTMGMQITKLKPVNGFCAETAAGISLFIATEFGIPVSTTHTIAGSIVGVGAVQKLNAVRWGVAKRIVWAWIITIPITFIVAAVIWYALALFAGF